MTNDEVNRYIHTEIMGNCIHTNVTRNAFEPLLLDCSDCGLTLNQREYASENWECRHSEKEPKFGAKRVCKYCGADDVSFDLGVRPRPDYCSDASPRSLLNEVVAKVDIDMYAEQLEKTCEAVALVEEQGIISWGDVLYQLLSPTSEQIARACVEAHKSLEAK